MITAYGDPDTGRKAVEGGAEALLTKPIDFVALRGEIDNRVAGASRGFVKSHLRHFGPGLVTYGLTTETDILGAGWHVAACHYRK